MDLDHLPEHLRRAGVAWVVSESAAFEVEDDDRKRTHLRAHHWAIMRGLPIDTEQAHDEAVADAQAYRDAHEQDVTDFLAWREQERRRI